MCNLLVLGVLLTVLSTSGSPVNRTEFIGNHSGSRSDICRYYALLRRSSADILYSPLSSLLPSSTAKDSEYTVVLDNIDTVYVDQAVAESRRGSAGLMTRKEGRR